MPYRDLDLYPRTYAQARAKGLSDKRAAELAHEAEEKAGELTPAEMASLEADRRWLEGF